MKHRNINAAICFGLVFWVGFDVSAHAQVVSSNIVGYINLVLFPGGNLIANQLGNGDNTLNTLFNQGSAFNQDIPEGTTFTEWDAASAQYLPLSTYDTYDGWSINYELGYGEGGLLDSPSQFTNPLVGNVWPGYSGFGPFVPPLVSGDGLFLLSCYIPIGSATFYDVVGRDPKNGESVTFLDALSQVSTTTTFENGSWNNSAPSLNVGQAAIFDLGPAPEPSAWALLGAGFFSLAAFRRMKCG
jgi:hypothetical protein